MNEGYKPHHTHEEHETNRLVHRLASSIEELNFHFDKTKTHNLHEDLPDAVALAAIREVCERQGGMIGIGNMEVQYKAITHTLEPEEALCEIEALHEAINMLPESLEEEYGQALERFIEDDVCACEQDTACIEQLLDAAEHRARTVDMSGDLLNKLRGSLYSKVFQE